MDELKERSWRSHSNSSRWPPISLSLLVSSQDFIVLLSAPQDFIIRFVIVVVRIRLTSAAESKYIALRTPIALCVIDKAVLLKERAELCSPSLVVGALLQLQISSVAQKARKHLGKALCERLGRAAAGRLDAPDLCKARLSRLEAHALPRQAAAQQEQQQQRHRLNIVAPRLPTKAVAAQRTECSPARCRRRCAWPARGRWQTPCARRRRPALRPQSSWA